MGGRGEVLDTTMKCAMAVSKEGVGILTNNCVWPTQDPGDLGKNCFSSGMGVGPACGLCRTGEEES